MEQEIKNGTYTIPEGFTAKIEDGKIIVEKKESEDEKIRKELIEELKSKLPFCSEEFTKHRIIRQIAYLEKQKKQKPTVNIDNFKSFMMQYLQDAANRKTDSEIESDTDKWAKKLLNLIEVKEQKPAEWSEEDEEMKESIIDYLESKQVYAHSRTNMIVWLKSLRPQSHWKPSEEQMKLLQEAEYALQGKDCHNRFVGFIWELKKLL